MILLLLLACGSNKPNPDPLDTGSDTAADGGSATTDADADGFPMG